MNAKRSRFPILLFSITAIIFLMIGGYCWWYFHLEKTILNKMDNWIAKEEQKGATIVYKNRSTSGFPFALRLSIEEPSIVLADGTAWRSANMTAAIVPLMPGYIEINAAGQHALTIFGRLYDLDAKKAQATLDLKRTGGLDAVNFVISGLKVEDVAVSGVIAEMASTMDADSAAGLSIKIVASDIMLPEKSIVGLEAGPISGEISLRVSKVEAIGGSRLSLTTWRDQGGVVDVDVKALKWPPLDMNGSATIALDGAMQPEFAGVIKSTGLLQILEGLRETGRVKPDAAVAARFMLGMLGKKRADGALEWSVPVSVQNRILSLGTIGVMSLPEIEWGRSAD